MRPVSRVSSFAVLLLLLTAIACYDAFGPATDALPSVASITVQPLQASVSVGKTIAFSAIALDASGNPIDGQPLTWRSQDTSIASVSVEGTVTPRRAGSTVITASTSQKAASAALTVLPPPVASVQISPASVSIAPGDTIRLAATLRDSAQEVLTDGRQIDWTSTDTAVATVSATGLVTAIAKGNSSVIATSDGVSDTTSVSVTLTPPAVASVSVTPTSRTLAPGATVQLSATAKDASGNVLAGHTITWASSNTSVATVSTSGLVKAIAAGTATVTATTSGKQGTAKITVAVPAVATVGVSPASASLQAGVTQQLTATLKDAAGNVLTGRSITWTSSNSATATVSGSGLVTAIAPGNATITATSEGKAGVSSITVLTSGSADHAGWYVSPSGSSSGDGSAANPWNLSTALSGQRRVQPGDTIWLRGGTYGSGESSSHYTSTLAGTASQPIIVRQYPGERATVNGSIAVNGSYTWYWGFEVANTSTDVNDAIGVDSHCPGCRFINLVIHDHNGDGLAMWSEGPDQEASGNIIFNNGFNAAAGGGGYGHGIYSQNQTGTKRIDDNILFNQFGYGLHIYGENAYLNNFTVDGNAIANSGQGAGMDYQLGGDIPVVNLTFTNNMNYRSPGRRGNVVRLGYNGGAMNSGAIVTGNYLVGQVLFERWTSITFQRNTILEPDYQAATLELAGGQALTTGTWDNNRYVSSGSTPFAVIDGSGGHGYTLSQWQQRTGFDMSSSVGSTLPTRDTVVVEPNRYEAGRANVIIYNWAHQSSVSVDLSSVLRAGDRYEVRNVQDFYGTPVASGTYGGGSITIPITSVTPPASISGRAVSSTGSEFNAYVVVKQ